MNWTWRNYILPNKHGDTHWERNVSTRYKYTLPHSYIQFNFCLSSLICAWMHCPSMSACACICVSSQVVLAVVSVAVLVSVCFGLHARITGHGRKCQRKSDTHKSPLRIAADERPPPSQHLPESVWSDPGHCSYLTAVVVGCQFGDQCGNEQNNYRKCRLDTHLCIFCDCSAQNQSIAQA